MLETAEQLDAYEFVLAFCDEQYPQMLYPKASDDIAVWDAYENRCASRVGLKMVAQRIIENPCDDILEVIDKYLDEIAFCMMFDISDTNMYNLEAQRCSVEHLQSYIKNLY